MPKTYVECWNCGKNYSFEDHEDCPKCQASYLDNDDESPIVIEEPKPEYDYDTI